LKITSVVVVIEIRMYRDAVARAVDEQHDLHLCGAADSTHHALVEIARAQPDVLLIDLGTRGAFEALRMTRTSSPATRVVALGFGGTDEEAVAAAEHGVNGYVGIDQTLDDVIAAVRGVMRGEAPCDGRIAAALLRRLATRAGEEQRCPAALAELTSRERRILELVAGGLSNKEIADELVIGVATVKSHVHAILRKLDVNRRGAAADLFHRTQSLAPGVRPAAAMNSG
jgi:DNA-binding NarL/FixJ family response regulator